jgi:transposase-like protein
MILKAALLAAAWAGKARKRGLESIAKLPIEEKDKEIYFLRDRIYQLETRIKIFQKQACSSSSRFKYSLKEKLFILWHMEYFQISRRQVTKTFGIARSTLYRWLKRIDDESGSDREPWNKTPESLAALVWRISRDNIDWACGEKSDSSLNPMFTVVTAGEYTIIPSVIPIELLWRSS